MSAVDRYGFDLVAVSDAHRTAVRLAFPDECTTGDEVRHGHGGDGRGGTVHARVTLGGLPSPDSWLTNSLLNAVTGSGSSSP